MMVSCASVVAALPEFSEGEASREVAGRVDDHLRACDACRRRVLRHRATLVALQSLPQVVPPPDLRQAVMQRVRSHPLPVYHRRERHLYLVKTVSWMAVTGIVGLASGSGAIILAKASIARTPFTDPTLLTDWLISLGQMAFSLVLSIATRAELPMLFSTPRGLTLWGGTLGAAFLLAFTGLLTGFGILVTARAVFRPRGR